MLNEILLPAAFVAALTLLVFVLGYALGLVQGRREMPRRVDFHVDVHDNEVWIPVGESEPDDPSEHWKDR